VTQQLNRVESTVVDNLLQALYHRIKANSVNVEEHLVDASVACYRFGEIVTINTPGEHHPEEQIATKLADVTCNGFSSIAAGEALKAVNCFSYKMPDGAKINIYRSKINHFWSINSDKDGIVALIRTYKDGKVDEMCRQYLPDGEIPAYVLEQLNEHL
jgi:hypothetical protein